MSAGAAKAGRPLHATGRERFLAHGAMILFAAFIAASFSIGKLALPYIDPMPLNAIRFLMGAGVMGFVAFLWTRNPVQIPSAPWRYAFTGALMAIYFVSMFIALTITSPVGTSAVFTLMPVLTAFFAWIILRQVVRPAVALSLAFAGLGSVWVIFRGDLDAILGFDIGQGEMIFFFGCICHALYAALIRRFDRGEPLVVSTFFLLAGVTFWISLFGFGDILATDWLALPAIVWIALAYLAVFPTAITFFLIQYATLRLPAAKVLAYGYLVPCFVIFYEGMIGHGWASLSVLAGAMVTVMGLVVLYFTRDG